MIQSYRKRLFYLTPLLIFLIAALPACCANETSAAGAALLSINGTAFLDENSDTVFTSGEPGLSGVIIRLMQGDVEIAYAVTGKSGEYAFSNLTPGGYTASAESAGAAGLTAPASGRYDLTLANLPAYYIDFGFNAPPTPPSPSAAIQSCAPLPRWPQPGPRSLMRPIEPSSAQRYRQSWPLHRLPPTACSTSSIILHQSATRELAATAGPGLERQ